MSPSHDSNIDSWAQRIRSEGVFVNRETQLETFKKLLAELPRQVGPKLLVFHAPSGYGKSSLRQQFTRLATHRASARGRVIKIAQISIHEESVISFVNAVTLLFQSLSRAKGLGFPAFTAILEDYLHLRPGEKPPRQTGASVDVEEAGKQAIVDSVTEVMSDFAKDQLEQLSKDAVGAAAHLVGEAGVPLVSTLVKNVGLGAFNGWQRSRLKKEHPVLKPMFQGHSPTTEEVYENFANILAKELAFQLKESGGSLVFFVDGYDRAKQYGTTRGPQFEQGWDKAMRKFYRACAIEGVPILVVLFSRSKTNWEQISKDWATEIADKETQLAGLKRSDAAKMLAGLGVDQQGSEDILNACAENDANQTYIPVAIREYAVRYLKTGVLPGPVGGPSRKSYQAELAAYYAEQISAGRETPEVIILLAGASCCEIIDKQILSELSRFLRVATLDRIIDNILNSEFFYKISPQTQFLRGGDQYTMPNPMRECFQRELTEADIANVHANLAIFMLSRATPARGEAVDDEHADCLKRAIAHATVGGLDDLRPFTEGEVAHVYRRVIQ